MYTPQLIDTAHIHLPDSIVELVESLAKNVHDTWARGASGKDGCMGLNGMILVKLILV